MQWTQRNPRREVTAGRKNTRAVVITWGRCHIIKLAHADSLLLYQLLVYKIHTWNLTYTARKSISSQRWYKALEMRVNYQHNAVDTNQSMKQQAPPWLTYILSLCNILCSRKQHKQVPSFSRMQYHWLDSWLKFNDIYNRILAILCLTTITHQPSWFFFWKSLQHFLLLKWQLSMIHCKSFQGLCNTSNCDDLGCTQSFISCNPF